MTQRRGWRHKAQENASTDEPANERNEPDSQPYPGKDLERKRETPQGPVLLHIIHPLLWFAEASSEDFDPTNHIYSLT